MELLTHVYGQAWIVLNERTGTAGPSQLLWITGTDSFRLPVCTIDIIPLCEQVRRDCCFVLRGFGCPRDGPVHPYKLRQRFRRRTGQPHHESKAPVPDDTPLSITNRPLQSPVIWSLLHCLV
jgi:hypothetical protein